MANQNIDLEHMISPDRLAVDIADRWREWNTYRSQKIVEWKELRNYLYATSTNTTSNKLLPWSNTTTTPKLTQIYDNLHANYMASLFPQMKWMKWEGDTNNDSRKDKVDSIEAYMYDRTAKSSFKLTVDSLVADYIQFGNCFGLVDYVDNYTSKETGEYIQHYTGPKLFRISPYDIVFNPTAGCFEESPKIIRSIKTLGQLKLMSEKNPALVDILDRMVSTRGAVRGEEATINKSEGFIADGFSSIQQYYESGYAEILTFYGDIYDEEKQEYHHNRIITIVDRAYLIENKEDPNWLGHSSIYHAGWRKRPDNLYAMGPLDNLVGLQYRIDHLENLKADVFDQIAYPMIKVQGEVEDFEFQPGERIYIGEEGDVGYLVPDATALQADLQIQTLENRMEELAGAPRQAMGIRTPGEKTAFEVEALQNAASRIFQKKTEQFEQVFLEPILNAMLECGRRNLDTSLDVATVDPQTGVRIFSTVTKEDIVGNGSLYPIGARHFAEKARRVQSLVQLHGIKVGDPSVGAHISGKEIARILSEELGEPDLFGENIGVAEQLETQQAMNDAEAVNQENLLAAEEGGF
jgi:hypothetical protein